MSIRERSLIFSQGSVRIRKTRRGVILFNGNDSFLGRSLENYGEFSEGETAVFQQTLRAGPNVTALDVGANIGVHTVTLSSLVGPEGIVYAFEPQRRTFQMLCANLALNEVENVRALQVGVGREKSRAIAPHLNLKQEGSFGSVSLETIDQEASGEEVSIIRLDDLELPRCDFIKIDVEGMEEDVLIGGEETIRRCRPVLYVENDRKEKSYSLLKRLLDFDYRLFRHRPRLVTAENYYKEDSTRFNKFISENVMCVHRESGIEIIGQEILSPDDESALP